MCKSNQPPNEKVIKSPASWNTKLGLNSPSSPGGRSLEKQVNIGLGLSAALNIDEESGTIKDSKVAAAAAFQKGSIGDNDSSSTAASRSPERHDTENKELEDLWAMPFQRARRRREDGNMGATATGWALIRQKKSTMVVLHKFLQMQQDESRQANIMALSVTNLPTLNMVVVRGPQWKWGDDDGGDGNPGTVQAINSEAGTVSVFWHSTEKQKDHYQYDVRSDLKIAPEGLAAPRQAPPKKSKTKRSPKPTLIDESKVIGDGPKEKEFAIARQESENSKNSPKPEVVDDTGLRRRNSQAEFNAPHQTTIIFDWDDTLFPTTYVRDDLNLSCSKPVEKQRGLSLGQVKEISGHLERCETQAEKLLRQAVLLGTVVFVTLARSPWVSHCCANFYPRMGEAVKSLGIPIVYAQEGNQVNYDKQKMMSNDDIEKYWAGMKGKAISREISSFYTQYPGQSWKNIISIGDSDFERLGTFQACEQYLKEKGLIGENAENFLLGTQGKTDEIVDSTGHVYHVRTKSFKMIDQPTPEELHVELPMIRGWIPQLVYLDNGCDFDLDALDSHEHIREIEDTLRGVQLPGEGGTGVSKKNPLGKKEKKQISKETTGPLKSPGGSKKTSPRPGKSPRAAGETSSEQNASRRKSAQRYETK